MHRQSRWLKMDKLQKLLADNSLKDMIKKRDLKDQVEGIIAFSRKWAKQNGFDTSTMTDGQCIDVMKADAIRAGM